MPSALTVFRLMAGPMRSGLMSQSDQSRRFDDAPITSGLPLINGYHQTRSAGPVRAICMARAVRCKTEAPRPTNVRAATMYQASNVEHLLRAIMGIRAHPRLTSGKTSLGHHGTQSLGCAGQTVRPSLHSISQTSAGKLSILNYSVSVLMFDVSRIT